MVENLNWTKKGIVKILKANHLLPQAMLIDWYIKELYKNEVNNDEEGHIEPEFIMHGYVEWLMKVYPNIKDYDAQVKKIKDTVRVNYHYALEKYNEYKKGHI